MFGAKPITRGLLFTSGGYASKPELVVALSTTTVINATLCAHYHEAPWHPGDCPADMQDNLAAYGPLRQIRPAQISNTVF